jgi:probable H4MPT-linked C1 transfer pathway protein
MSIGSAIAPQAWVGLDIGGANIKAAHSAGSARTVPFEVWKRPDELGQAIAAIVATLPLCRHAAVTMTAELCDCFPTKKRGVNAVLDAVSEALPGWTIRVWGADGAFHAVEEARERTPLVAAANWLALAILVARLVPEERGILIDIGTTTTDLIPLDRGTVAARGRSDTERLQCGELVYAGVRRTPICALATELPLRGQSTGLAAELFASTLDVYLVLGDIESNPLDLSTPDGRPSTADAARDRLARMVGTDRDGFSSADALAFAQAADSTLLDRLATAADRACGPTIGRPAAAVIAGSGDFLARRLALRILEPHATILSLKEAWGGVASSAGCAYALVQLVAEQQGTGGPLPGAAPARPSAHLEMNHP